jgi:HTH-type transcriptional regulator, transcriptional repressor of NAD biosynthesis genes
MTNGVIIGRFEPPHKGHLHLIDSAAKQCDILHVMVCYKDGDEIPGKFRYESLRYIYDKNPNIIVHDILHDYPNYPNEANSKDEFYDIWVTEVYNHVPKPDYVFTSTDYGDEFAEYLGVKHILIGSKFDETGVARDVVPVSGTDIRKSCFDHWDFIPDIVKPYFIKKVVLIGPESSGKTTMAKLLSKHFDTQMVPEYARRYWEEINAYKKSKEIFTSYNLSHIAVGQMHLEDELIPESNKIAICDTDILLTKTWCDLYFGYSPKWMIDETYRRHGDIYLLMDIDFDWIDDGTREFKNERKLHFCRIISELNKRNLNYKLISGTIEERLQECIKKIESIML